MEYITVQTREQLILCCKCATPIPPNPANMCLNCIQSEVDITDGIPKQIVMHWCKFCERYLQPPGQWLSCALESSELLALCLRKVRGLNRVRLVDAGFIWTEPHSRRIKVKLTIQKEVFASTILQQVFVIEYVIASQVCEECHRAEAKDMWRACVQVRQKVAHKRTFFFLEQLILKHGQHKITTNIAETPDGIDFFFSTKTRAHKFTDFLQSVVPCRYKTAQEIISADWQSNTASFKYTFSVEIAPICKDDLVCLPKHLRPALGNIAPLVLCYRVGNSIHLVDPNTLQVADVMSGAYWRGPFTSICAAQDLTEFVVLDVEPLGPTRGKFVLADVQVARKSDFGRNDTMFIVRSHLGAILQPGDTAMGYDLVISNFNNNDFDLLDRGSLPDIVLVKKGYPNRRRKNRQRNWKLQQLSKELTHHQERLNNRKDVQQKTENDYELFLRDVEEDPEMRAAVNLFKDPNAQPALETAPMQAEDDEDEPEEEDFPEVNVDELLDEFNDMGLDDAAAPPDDADADADNDVEM